MQPSKRVVQELIGISEDHTGDGVIIEGVLVVSENRIGSIVKITLEGQSPRVVVEH